MNGNQQGGYGTTFWLPVTWFPTKSLSLSFLFFSFFPVVIMVIWNKTHSFFPENRKSCNNFYLDIYIYLYP